jgi:NADPH:quinone reductase-like Zn-dependent oxidoreductase
VEEGRIKPVVSKTFPMQEANEALLDLPNEGTAGRIVLTI